MTQSAFHAWIVGSPSGYAGMRGVLDEAGLDVSQFSELPTSGGDVQLVCVGLDHPDQFSTRAIRQFLATFSYARIIVVLGEWCASLQRSRTDWPLSVTINRAAFRARLQNELLAIRGEVPPLPLTAGREEFAESLHCRAMPAAGQDRTADVVSVDRAFRETLRQQLREAGFQTSSGLAAGAALVVVDSDPQGVVGQPQLERLRAANPSADIVLLSSSPTSQPILSGARVLSRSKFASVGEWLSELTPRLVVLLALVMAGCNPSPPVQLKDAAKTPTWTEQVEAVRRGERHAVTVSEPVSASDWSLLTTGCERVEVLEADQVESKVVDFEVLRSMSGLRRLKLGGRVTDEVAAVIGQLPSLSELLITSETLTDSGVAQFASLPLVQLRLQAPRLTDAAMTDIGKLTSLRFLHLVDVPITDAGLPPLVGVKTLESLYLDGAKCTEDGLSSFLKQRPDIHFHRDQMHLKDDPQGHAH
jgi:hypothetical protein